MKTLFGFSGMAIVSLLLYGFATNTLCAQYLPPVIGNAFQSGPGSDFVYPEKKQEMKAVRQNQDTKFIYREYESDELRVPEQYQIVITPVADQKGQAATTQPPQVQPPKVVPLPNATGQPQEMPGMVPQTIYYFPPPTFPAPVPLTVYRPAPQQPTDQIPQTQDQDQQTSYPQSWSPYGPMQNQMQQNPMYAPPMLVQPQHFGPPQQQDQGKHHDKKERRFGKSKSKSKSPGEPGEPVVGPPTLVYPNGIVVRPKVYLPNQPFKNTVRAITP